MKIETLIRKLEQEKRKYGNIDVVLHAPLKRPEWEQNTKGRPFYDASIVPKAIEDVATYANVWTRAVWISTEPAE